MSEQISNLIDSIVNDDAVESQKIFNSIMADKIADRLQDYKKEVSTSFFNSQAKEQETEENATE